MDNLKDKQIDILLSTYNGGKYLSELIQSILNQTYQDWKLIIRDDGSEDNTIDIIQNLVIHYPDKIIYIDDRFSNLGPSKSYSKLMEYSNSDYIMFCDQDDIWLNEKVELTFKKMLMLEKEFLNKPLLVHTDLTVVDENLKTISNSFWKYQKLNPKYKELNNILVQNIVTGCSMMINKKLKELAYPIPDEAIMHDWWIALVASIYLGIYEINSPLILYRQHNDNNVGAKRYSFKYFISKYDSLQETILKKINQGEILFNRHSNKLDTQHYRLVKVFTNILDRSRLTRLIYIFKYKYKMSGLIRNIGFIIILIFLKRKNK